MNPKLMNIELQMNPAAPHNIPHMNNQFMLVIAHQFVTFIVSICRTSADFNLNHNRNRPFLST